MSEQLWKFNNTEQYETTFLSAWAHNYEIYEMIQNFQNDITRICFNFTFQKVICRKWLIETLLSILFSYCISWLVLMFLFIDQWSTYNLMSVICTLAQCERTPVTKIHQNDHDPILDLASFFKIYFPRLYKQICNINCL